MAIDPLAALKQAPESPVVEGSLNYGRELRRVISAMLKRSPASRYEIGARMSELLGEEVTKAQLDAWTAESKDAWRFPFEYAAALEAACCSNDLQGLLAQKRGGLVLDIWRELGWINWRRAELDAREQQIRNLLGEQKK